MIIYPIVYPSAMQFWLNPDIDSIIYRPAVKNYHSLPKGYHISSVQNNISTLVQQYGFCLPLRLLASASELRINKNGVSCSINSAHVPDNCFSRIDDLPGSIPVYVACPEYCFLSAASELSLYELIQLGYQLCAKYIPDGQMQYLQRGREPITTASKITAFLEKCTGAKGVKKARQAISYVLDNSNSPMETKFAMPAVLSVSLGGFALRRPNMNKNINLTGRGAEILGYDKCCCDLVWEQEKVIGEYDSTLTHLDPRQHIRDKKRASALAVSGYTVISITSDFLRNFESFQRTYDGIRYALRMKRDRQRMDASLEKRYELFHFLLTH